MIKKLIPLSLLALLTGCGSGSSGEGSIDLVAYLPATDMSKPYLKTIDDGSNSSRDTYTLDITRELDQLTYKSEDQIIKTITIQDKELQKEENNQSIIADRFVDKGDTIFTHEYATKIEEIKLDEVILGTKTTQAVQRCKVDDTLERLELYSIPYTGEILKIKCTQESTVITKVKEDLPSYVDLQDGEVKTDNDISYIYLQKGLGIIVFMDDNCLVKDSEGNLKIDDTAGSCESKTYIHEFFLN